MAFSLARSGDRLGISFVPATVPKGYTLANYAAAWSTANTLPAVGDLVIPDTSGNDLVKQAGASVVPYGLVWSVNSTNGTLSILELRYTRQIILESATSPTIGHSVQANGSVGTVAIGGNLRNQVKDVAAAAGAGYIWSSTAVGSVWLVVVSFGNITTTNAI